MIYELKTRTETCQNSIQCCCLRNCELFVQEYYHVRLILETKRSKITTETLFVMIGALHLRFLIQ